MQCYECHREIQTIKEVSYPVKAENYWNQTFSAPENNQNVYLCKECYDKYLTRGTEPDHTLDPDVLSFDKQQRLCKDIFLERRKNYGNHIVNAKRFPNEHRNGLYLKCVRAIRNIDDGEKLDEDTLRDLSNFAIIILSSEDV